LDLPPEPVLSPVVVVETPIIEPLPDISAQTSSRVSQATYVPEAKVKGDLITVETRNGYAMLRVCVYWDGLAKGWEPVK